MKNQTKETRKDIQNYYIKISNDSTLKSILFPKKVYFEVFYLYEGNCLEVARMYFLWFRFFCILLLLNALRVITNPRGRSSMYKNRISYQILRKLPSSIPRHFSVQFLEYDDAASPTLQ